ncbi:glycosyltransferase family 4 protein [Rhodocytophaga rosea]|uniref:Glycosyltransferase family 4 protein n=1 Tax=Rhodocytophaga rosea TaxID=2704465 RepID=A0A6C0GM03_9BACT|nr:glycosyltransferase family 4 protein [Rhodocytophaga rosea]QHT68844.1 glycosyltransferase family 4 protein [Rhodocytophaga rosea]
MARDLRTLKILFIARATLYSSPGGDTVQIDSTAKYLRKLNVHVDIKMANEQIKYSTYDLLHFFNIIRPADILWHVKASKKPYVISTIFVDYSEYDQYHRKDTLGYVSKFLPADLIEYAKVIARMIKNGEKINSWDYLLKGHKSSIQYLIKNAKCLLPNSTSEYNRLYAAYRTPQKYFVIPNAIDTERFYASDSETHERHNLLSVARIEGRKNQLNLIRAVRNSPYELYIVGKPSPNNLSYYEACLKETTSNIHFIGHLTQEQVSIYYQQAKVHILPSWFETTGLSTLEAAIMGCNIVITNKGDTQEYFGEHAYYCDPESPESIRQAIDAAYKAPSNEALRELILKNYIWEKTAQKTLEAYLSVLSFD